MKYSKDRIDHAWQMLERFRGRKVRADVLHVSRSGMSRDIAIVAVDDDGCIVDIVQWIAIVLGEPYKELSGHFTTRVGGCGMDMRFNLLSNFNYAAAARDADEKAGRHVDFAERAATLGLKGDAARIYDTYFFDIRHL